MGGMPLEPPRRACLRHTSAQVSPTFQYPPTPLFIVKGHIFHMKTKFKDEIEFTKHVRKLFLSIIGVKAKKTLVVRF